MSRILVQCDGAAIPRSIRNESWDKSLEICTQGEYPDLNLRIQNLSCVCLSAVEDAAADLVRIASYVYGADQSVSRGGIKDVYGRSWRRQFALVIPVSNPDLWNQDSTHHQLQQILAFLTDDSWEFRFVRNKPENNQLTLNTDIGEMHGTPDSVIMFSGGADSLCATVDAIQRSHSRPVLVSHRSTPRTSSRQKRLIDEIRRLFGNWDFPHISPWIHRVHGEAAETSQRSRSFLYASLGAAIASQLNVESVILADNGIVTLNPPINPQLLGARATRSTHPKFIAFFNRFANTVLPHRVVVHNTLRYSTRAEALDILKQYRCPELLQETVSCAHQRGRTNVKPHCGVCSQCIDRRFGTTRAKLEEYDLPERYEVDIFTDPLPEGDPRTLALSYVSFARDISQSEEDSLFEAYPELSECITHTENAAITAQHVTDLLKRHASQVLEVIEAQLAQHSHDLVTGSLPTTSLLCLVASGSHLQDWRRTTINYIARILRNGLPPFFQNRRPANEREVQDAVQGLMQVINNGIRREVPLLPFAAIGTKPDFSSHNGGESRGWLFVEMKYPKTRSRLNAVISEITSRGVIYSRQGAYVLFCVYDPHRCIVDDEQFKVDCSTPDKAWVEIVR